MRRTLVALACAGVAAASVCVPAARPHYSVAEISTPGEVIAGSFLQQQETDGQMFSPLNGTAIALWPSACPGEAAIECGPVYTTSVGTGAWLNASHAWTALQRRQWRVYGADPNLDGEMGSFGDEVDGTPVVVSASTLWLVGGQIDFSSNGGRTLRAAGPGGFVTGALVSNGLLVAVTTQHCAVKDRCQLTLAWTPLSHPHWTTRRLPPDTVSYHQSINIDGSDVTPFPDGFFTFVSPRRYGTVAIMKDNAPHSTEILATDNGGHTWTLGSAECESGFTSNEFGGVWVESATTWFNACYTSPDSVTLYRTANAGRRWTVALQCGPATCADFGYPFPLAITGNGRWAYAIDSWSADRPVVAVSDDGGRSWRKLPVRTLVAAPAGDVTLVPVGPDGVDLETAVEGIATDVLARSVDGGPWTSE